MIARAPIPEGGRPYPRWAHHPWLQSLLGILLVGAALALLSTLPSSLAERAAISSGRTCATADAFDRDCLTEVRGVIDDRRGRPTSPRWHFSPSDRGVEDQWFRIDRGVRADPTVVAAVSGRRFVALYAGTDLVAFATDAEPVVVDEPFDLRQTSLLALFLGAIGTGSLSYAWYRRSRPVDVSSSARPVPYPLLGQVGATLGIAALIALFMPTATASAITLAAITAPLGGAIAWRRRAR